MCKYLLLLELIISYLIRDSHCRRQHNIHSNISRHVLLAHLLTGHDTRDPNLPDPVRPKQSVAATNVGNWKQLLQQ
jgi:hypothetical protein